MNFVEIESTMLSAKFQDHRTSNHIEDFKGFYHKWAWRPSWSCDLDHLYTFSFPLSKEATHEIWLWSSSFRGEDVSKMVGDDNDDNDGRRSMGIL